MPDEDDRETGRTEALSDGIFAIAVTLLALDLRVPALREPTRAALAEALRAEIIPLLAFVLSFATIVIMWMNHHQLFRSAHHLTGRVMAANGLLLMLVALCPVPTALLAEHLGTQAGTLAAGVYAGYFVLVNVSYNMLLEAIASAPHAAEHDPMRSALRARRVRFRIGFVAYAVAAVAALASPWITVVICALLWGLWARVPGRASLFEK